MSHFSYWIFLLQHSFMVKSYCLWVVVVVAAPKILVSAPFGPLVFRLVWFATGI